MRERHSPDLLVLAVIGSLLALLPGARLAQADHQPSNAVVTITDNPDPAASGGNIVYTVAGKDDGPVKALDATLEAEIPAGATFVSCRTSPVGPCAVSGAIVTAVFPTVAAHATVKLIVTVRAPDVLVETLITLRGKFSGESMHMDERFHSTTVLPLATRLLMHPSLRTVTIACGGTADAALFGADTEAQVLDGLVCGNGSGLTFTASGKTLNLGGKKFVSTTRVTGNAGIIVGPDATNVTINGGGTQGTKGIEQFDYCVKDLDGNTGLLVTGLRCFRAKTAGILIVSNDVAIENTLVDNTIADSSIEPPHPGGIGIDAGGDNLRVKDTIVRRSGTIGFWAHGADVDGSGLVATYDGNTSTSKIETNFGIGALLSGGPHKIKGTKVQGDDHETGTSTDGIVVSGDARGTILEEVVVKKHRGHGIRVDAGAVGTVIERTTVEEIGGNGYVVDAPSRLNGNTGKLALGDCFRLNTSAILTSNRAEECAGDGFVVNGAAVVDSNTAVDNGGRGFVLTNVLPSGVETDWAIVGVGDLNGDGKADLLWRHTSGMFFVWLMNGTAVIGTGSPAGPGLDWMFLGLGDFNGDGKADILLQHSSGVVYVWLMDGATIIGSGSPSGLDTEWAVQGIGDLNGDGRADILLRHASGVFYVWFIDGTTIIDHGSPSGAELEWAFQGLGDFNGDGRADILLRHASGVFYVWLIDGTTIIGHGSPSGAELEWTFQHTADLDGDGRKDILLRHSLSGLVTIWLMDGPGISASGAPGGLGLEWAIQGVDDFDGDGKADILWRDASGRLTTWYMSGASLIAVSGAAQLLSNTAEGNVLGGYLLPGSGNVLRGNSAKSNGGVGFDISGSDNALDTNDAERSTGPEFVIGPDNLDEDSNRANGSTFSFTAAGGSFE